MDLPIIGPILRWLQATFFSKQLQIVILGLQSAGKTSLVNVITSGQFAEEMVPTVGFNVSFGCVGSGGGGLRDGRWTDASVSLSLYADSLADEKGTEGKRSDQDVGHRVSTERTDRESKAMQSINDPDR